MKESMPSRVQPDQAAQKPVICVRDSLVCNCAAAGAALDMLDVLFMTLFPPASLYWLFLSSVRKVSLYFYQTPMATRSLVILQLPKRTLIYSPASHSPRAASCSTISSASAAGETDA